MNSADKNQILDEILKRRSFDLRDLPSIGEEDSWWGDFLKNQLDWLRSLFSGSGSKWVLPTYDELLQIVGIVCYIILGLLLIFVAYKIFQYLNSRSSATSSSDQIPIKINAQTEAEVQLEDFLSIGNYNLAMRIRWKLFLKRMKFASSSTPSDLSDLIRKHPLGNLYEIMFSPRQPLKEEVDRVFGVFSDIENIDRASKS